MKECKNKLKDINSTISKNSSELIIEIVKSIPKEYSSNPHLINGHIYAQGSYFNNKLPKEVQFTTIIVKNTLEQKRTLINIHFEICYLSDNNDILSSIPLDIYFPSESYYGKKIDPNHVFLFTVLHEHLISSARAHFPTKKAKLRAVFEKLDGSKIYSKPISIDLNYPNSPLQDIALSDYYPILKKQEQDFKLEYNRIKDTYNSLHEYANLHKNLGIHLISNSNEKYWLCKEYAPNANEIYFIYDSNGYGDMKSFAYTKIDDSYFELKIPYQIPYHGMYYELHIYGKNILGKQIRVPAFANWVEQNKDNENQWCARFWHPENSYNFKFSKPKNKNLIIYEAHVGMAKHNLDKSSENERGFGTYTYFTNVILPYIKEAGYNAVQLMGIPEHPLYKSFGYQVSSYFAPSHRFGTLNEFKLLVDTAHKLGISVLLDIVHSHACPNTEQGLNCYDTGAYFFNKNKQTQWGTSTFNYENEMTRKFLLSNCRYWLEEFQIDGFRFDAVGSIIFTDEGFQDDFSHVNACFYTANGENRRNHAGILYLQLANTLIHEHSKFAPTIAEEFSGSPDISCKPKYAGLGFDYRFTMGIPDFWDKYIKSPQPLWTMWYECSHHRTYEKTISYVECHDQSINGDDAFIWRLIGNDMYFHMSVLNTNWNVSRGLALIKLMKLITFTCSHKGYMDFMGNEFAHPEWLDADLSAYRQWTLKEDQLLQYKGIYAYNKDMLAFANNEFFANAPRIRLVDEEKKSILFERGQYVIALNFNEIMPNTAVAKVEPGKYIPIFSSDEIKYSGHNNLTITKNVEYFTNKESGTYEQDISIYLPPLTALILKRV